VLGFQEETTEDLGDIKTRLGRVEQNLDQLPRALAEIVRAEFDRRDDLAGRQLGAGP
jgi:hypothetical protein